MMDGNWLMVVTIVILAAGALLGYINGLIKTVLNLVIGAVTLVLVLLLSPRVSSYLQTQTSLPNYIESRVEAVVWEQAEGMLENSQEQILDLAGQQKLVEISVAAET